MRLPGIFHLALASAVACGLCVRLHRPESGDVQARADSSLYADAWVPATESELALATMEVQRGDPNGMFCEYEWKHGCLGHSRNYYDAPPPPDAAARASRIFRAAGTRAAGTHNAQPLSHLDGQAADVHPLDGLKTVLQRVMSEPPCALSFLGDSITSDSFAAAVHGALTLGFRKVSWCLEGAGEPLYWDEFENESLRVLCVDPPFNLYVDSDMYNCSATASAQVKLMPPVGLHLHGQCETLSINLVRHAPGLASNHSLDVGPLVNASSYVILNQGVRGNDPEAYAGLLRWSVRPFLETGRYDKILWRETLPQHWWTGTGSGTWSDCERSMTEKMKNRLQVSMVEMADGVQQCGAERWCAPITNATAANWRNELFKEWLRNESDVAAASLRVVPAFRFFVDRHDLHVDDDCTHFLYSPFPWAKVWEGVAAALDDHGAGQGNDPGSRGGGQPRVARGCLWAPLAVGVAFLGGSLN